MKKQELIIKKNNPYLVETISGIESIKVLGGGDLVKNRWRDSATKQSSVSRISRSLAQIAVNTAQSSQQICLVGIVFYGVFLVSDGTVSMGAMVAAVSTFFKNLSSIRANCRFSWKG